MFIAHLPAGLLLTRFLQRRLDTTEFLRIGLIASVLPDIDLLYYYFVDGRQTLHHEYWTHLPFFWLVLCIITLAASRTLKNRTFFLASAIFFCNIFLHLLLDTFVGGISWLVPFSWTSTALLNVPAASSSWIANFVFHWTFLVELGIVLWALIVLNKERLARP